MSDLLADVETVGELAAEDRDDAESVVTLDLVLAAQRRPVGVGLVAAVVFDHEWTHAGALGDHVGDRERPGEVEPGIDLIEEERPVVVVRPR